MLAYVLRRLLATIPVMLIVAVLAFLMLRLTPSDPAAIAPHPRAAAAYRSGSLIFPGRVVRAAEKVDIEVRRGETVGIVGESGSGKSTVAGCIARLVQPTSGAIRIGGIDVAWFSERRLRARPRRDARRNSAPLRRRSEGRGEHEREVGPSTWKVTATLFSCQ